MQTHQLQSLCNKPDAARVGSILPLEYYCKTQTATLWAPIGTVIRHGDPPWTRGRLGMASADAPLSKQWLESLQSKTLPFLPRSKPF